MTYKGIEIGVPTIGMIDEFIRKEKFSLDAETIYEEYAKRNWLTRKGKPVKTLESIICAANGVANSGKSKSQK